MDDATCWYDLLESVCKETGDDINSLLATIKDSNDNLIIETPDLKGSFLKFTDEIEFFNKAEKFTAWSDNYVYFPLFLMMVIFTRVG